MSNLIDRMSAEFKAIYDDDLKNWIWFYDLEAGPTQKLSPGFGHSVWSHALIEFKAGHRERLSAVTKAYLLDSNLAAEMFGKIPNWACEQIGKITLGTLKPDARGLKNRKLSDEKMEDAVGKLRVWQARRTRFLDPKNVAKLADQQGMEAAEIVKATHKEFGLEVARIAES